MLESFDLISGIAQPLISFPSPPGWNAYVGLLEKALDFLAVHLHSAGLAVVVFTIIIKTLLLPLTIKATRSSKAMQELQPKIKELQKKYGKDKQKLYQETTKLYGQYQANPMAGCLPMLIQMPIFLGLYRAILHLSNNNVDFSISDYWAGGFLWLPSLADPDPYHILPIMAGVFQFVQTKMMRPAGMGKPSDPQQAMMNTMMNFLPITVVLFGWGFASGPVIYWVTQSVYSVVQQWLITGWGSMKDWFPWLPELPEHRRLGYKPPRDPSEFLVLSEDGTPVRPKGVMGWFQTKMEEAQAQQAARQGAVTVDEDVEVEAAPKAATARPVKKSSKKHSAKSLQEQVDEEVVPAEPAKSNGHSAKGAPKRTRSTRKTAQSG
ncbi:MAG: YidC/Oxa1 family membrane protein insertase [Thermomicrobiales bacterium]|nr:YidC/Oxa1 family membrane protein insertase [Thermomicrobiales bacterium]